jgi:hypothetical protein
MRLPGATFKNDVFDGHKVAAIFGKQGSLPMGFADLSIYRDHSPAIRYESHYRF